MRATRIPIWTTIQVNGTAYRRRVVSSKGLPFVLGSTRIGAGGGIQGFPSRCVCVTQ